MYNPKTMQYENDNTVSCKQPDVQTRLRIELSDLSTKIIRLAAFIHTEKFDQLEEKHKKLLYAQLNIMADYRNVLELRITDLDNITFSPIQERLYEYYAEM